MAELTSLESFQTLYTDLSALSDPEAPGLFERIAAQLENLLGDFKILLNKTARNEQSRQSLATGKLEVDGVEYSVNEEFQQEALRLADDLNLDERQAAQLFLQSQNETDTTGRPARTISIIQFHQRRKCLLDCLRVILQQIADEGQNEELREFFRAFITQVTLPKGTTEARFVQKCLSTMADVKSWLQGLADKFNSASVLGQEQVPEFIEIIDFQRASLVMQHETLGVIVHYLVKQGYSSLSDLEHVLNTLKVVDKYDSLLLHYFPALGAYIARFGGSEQRAVSIEEARNLNNKFLNQADQNQWTLPYVHAAFRVWWLAEYSGWYNEGNNEENIPETQLEDESKQRSRQFSEALKDGAFDFLLCLSADSKPVEWHDPARQGLRQWLQRKTPMILPSPVPYSESFQIVLKEQLETFIEAFITNLPDVLRKLRTDEDEQRQLNKEHDHDLDLERFLVVMAFVFEGRPKAAFEEFWDMRDGALMGFVHWASKRASTPLLTAFCEMLQSISEDEECATSAHEFLLDDGAQSSGKMRRTHSLSWNQIFKELTFFCSKIRDRPSLPQTQTYRPGKPQNDLAEIEPEASMMLESYLRLIARLCTESEVVRQFLAQHPSFRLSDILFQLASSGIGPRLRACAFSTLQSFVSHKTKEPGEFLWTALDLWISGGYAPGSTTSKAALSTTSISGASSAMNSILRGLTSGFEEPNAFVTLLTALVSPYENESGLHDGLPFPESLGASSRMAGIDPYIDYVIGEIFGSRASELGDVIQQRLLRLTCLDFISTCLESFNEDLVIFASQSNVSVDLAINTSTLENYVLLHPFSRVMEWMFNDKIATALFATIHQDIVDISSAAPDSPLIMSLLKGINVVTLILDLQPTYLDIIEPLIKSHSSHRRNPVPNGAFTSFEDGIITHLSILPDLGRYCGTGHPELVIASLKLLEKLSASPRLTSIPGNGTSRGVDRNKALAALDDDAEAISRILLREMEADIDINRGPDCSEYIIKIRILDFMSSCLRASPDQPTIAHLLLGFKCGDYIVNIDGEGSFSRGVSLFHTILDLVINAPLADDLGMAPWLVALSQKGLQVLKALWSSPITSVIVATEMRSNEAFFMMFVKENVIHPGVQWNGLEIANPTFPTSPALACLSDFMYRRTMILQYLSFELRQVARSHSPSLKQRIFETLMGSTRVEDGQMHPHASVFDLFDFMEPQYDTLSQPPQLSWFSDVDLHACIASLDDTNLTINLEKLEELLILRRAELTHAGRLTNPQDMDIVNMQAQELLEFYNLDNRLKNLSLARLKLLKSWVQLMLIMLQTIDFDETSKTSIMLRTLQTIMPRLESDFDNILEATELAKLARSVIFSLDFDSQSFRQGDLGDLISDRLFHLFQISLKAINSLGSQTSLKEIFYTISYRYLTGMADVSSISGITRRHSIQTIKSAGERFIDVVCDDAYASEPTCRISALLILGALITLAKKENSKYIIDSLTRLNFITILVGSIENITNDLQETSIEHVDMQLSYCNARLSLLLQIAQTRYGAAAVLNAGLFHAIKESGLFSIDPELGVDIEGPSAISKHYSLLAAILRVLCTALLSRGAQNQQSLEQGRRFLAENRLPVLAIFKKSAGLVPGVEVTEQIEELADSFVLLVTFTGFLEFESEKVVKKPTLTAFT